MALSLAIMLVLSGTVLFGMNFKYMPIKWTSVVLIILVRVIGAIMFYYGVMAILPYI